MDFKRIFTFVLIASVALFVSCSKDNLTSNKANRTDVVEDNYAWVESADPQQTWVTSRDVELNIVANGGSKVQAITIGSGKSIVLAEKSMMGNGVMNVAIPQGVGDCFGLVCSNGTPYRQYAKVNLTNNANQRIDVQFQDGATYMQEMKAEAVSGPMMAGSSYDCNSFIPDCGYISYGNWAWDNLVKVLPEGSKIHKYSIIDYEAIALGDRLEDGSYSNFETIYVSFLYGNSANYGEWSLGYYTHSEGSFSDIEFFDVTPTHTPDYINGKCKIQYRLDGGNRWYDSNFDLLDAPDAKKKSSRADRRGDDIYNNDYIRRTYGDRITAVRGLGFKITIPKGKVFGFYLRGGKKNMLQQQQRNRLKRLGVPQSRMPEFGACYSKADMNLAQGCRSAIVVYDNYTFMGFEDATNEGDKDCNDVVFALTTAKGEPYVPEFTEETKQSENNEEGIKNNPANIRKEPATPAQGVMPGVTDIIDSLQRWTLCFEDCGTNIDFDFNDIVLQIAPVTRINKVAVWLMAAGGKRHTDLYYDDVYLGEAHELFGVSTDVMVNTSMWESLPVVCLSGKDGLEWPEGKTIAENRHLFKIVVYNPEGTEIESVVYGDSVIDTPKASNVPQAVCVAGEWEWPLETTNVEIAYPGIGKWGCNFNNSSYWDWYLNATPETTKQWWNWWEGIK